MKARLSLLSLTVALAGCSSVSVTTDYDRAVDFSRYRSYAWAPEPPVRFQPGPSVRAALRDAVESGLAAKGLHRSAHPDFTIAARVASRPALAVHRSIEWTGYGQPWAYYGPASFHRWPGSFPYPVTEIDRYIEGRVVLDFVDPRSQRLIWRGEGLADFGSPEHNARSVAEAIRRMLEKFPPLPSGRGRAARP